MSDLNGGIIEMNLGKDAANKMFYDCLGNVEEKVYVDSNGNGKFSCAPGSVSVWIRDGQYVN